MTSLRGNGFAGNHALQVECLGHQTTIGILGKDKRELVRSLGPWPLRFPRLNPPVGALVVELAVLKNIASDQYLFEMNHGDDADTHRHRRISQKVGDIIRGYGRRNRELHWDRAARQSATARSGPTSLVTTASSPATSTRSKASPSNATFDASVWIKASCGELIAAPSRAAERTSRSDYHYYRRFLGR
jgi:hypothetical protein